MPVTRGKDTHGSFYRWGSGKKYYYTVGDAKSRSAARAKATRRQTAAYANGYRSGKGLISNIVGRFQLRESAPPKVREWIQKKGKVQIVAVEVVRNPLSGPFKKILNWITLGEFNSKIKTLNYDDVFHLFMVLHFADGSKLRVDKNHVVEITPRIEGLVSNGGAKIVAGNPHCDLGEFFARGERKAGGPRPMWIYSAVSPTWNCQAFVRACLWGSGLWTVPVVKFVMQDAHQLVTGGLARRFLGAVTGLASRADTLIHGKGSQQ